MFSQATKADASSRRGAEGALDGPWTLPVVALALLTVLALVVWLYRPTKPLAEDAPPDAFSAGRAAQVLTRILGDESPHPVGSAANARVRDRILKELDELGLTPEVRPGQGCVHARHRRVCVDVENIVVRIAGSDPAKSSGPAVMLVAHYDSVPEGPGAADDGAGVAALLEIARILRATPPERPLVLLFDDGEEAGLFGARAYVESQATDDVRWIVNLEARGTSGPSLMFETSDNNAGLIRKFARHVERPMTSSAYYAIYREMPNDTDLTVFKAAGYSGVNLAFIGGASRYHTPLDNLAHLDRGSLQHQGETALQFARGLASGAPADASDSAVFFDVLSLRTVWWPARWTPWFAAGALALFSVALLLLYRSGNLRNRGLGVALGLLPGVIGASTLIGLGLGLLWGSVGTVGPSPWIASPHAALVACWLGGFLSCWLPAGLPRLVSGAFEIWCGVWVWWAIAAVGLAATVPEVSFLFLVPLAFAGATGALYAAAPGPLSAGAVALAPAVAAAIIWFPHVYLLYDAIGLAAPIALVAPVTLALAPILPLIRPRRRVHRNTAIALAGAFVMVAGTAAFPQS